MSEFPLARLDRLRPLHSAFHDSSEVSEPCEEGVHEKTISDISAWSNGYDQPKDDAMVFWAYGNARSTTTAIAQSVAMQAHREDRLLASFFFSWAENAERRDPAHLIPTNVYRIALFDKEFLRRVAHAIDTERDIRDKEASVQISVLLKKSFEDAITPSRSPLLIVIDALDACDRLEEPKVAQDMALFIQTLTELPLRIKVLITSRFTQSIRRVLEKLHSPGHQSLVLSPFRTERQTQIDVATHVSEADKGTPLIS
jgi:hypothetical protein